MSNVVTIFVMILVLAAIFVFGTAFAAANEDWLYEKLGWLDEHFWKRLIDAMTIGKDKRDDL